MKHLEPLQGIKLIQGHSAVHIAMFTASWFIDTTVSASLTRKDLVELAFQLVRWGHLVSVILQFVMFSLKA